MSEELIIKILDTLKVIGPSVLLPIIILWLTNSNARKNREREQNFELKKLEKDKELGIKYEIESSRKKHHIVVHSALIKILFEVQKLHISLSGNCVDINCIDDSVKEFQNQFSIQQGKISEFQIYLSSNITNRLYKFYSLLGELLVELKEIKDAQQYDIAIASVYNYSVKLAEEIIQIQDELVKKRKDLKEKFNALELPHFKGCCGAEPPPEIRNEYQRIRKKKMSLVKQLDNLPLESNNKLELRDNIKIKEKVNQ